MKVLDVGPFEEGLQNNSTMLGRLEGEMKAIESTVGGLVALDDSLKGQGGDAIRAFYNDCHLPFLQFFATFKTSYDSVLSQMKSALDTLEPASNGFIQESFLEADVKDGLTTIDQLTLTLTDEANGIMDEVSDIVALPHLDDSDVHEGVKSAQTKREKTVTDLHEFDSTQTAALTQIEADLLTMELWLLEIEGMMNDGLTDIDFQAESWAEYSGNHPLKTELEHRVDVMNGVVEDGSEDEAGDVSSANEHVLNLKTAIGWVKKGDTAATGLYSSYGMFVAGKDGGLSTTKVYNPKTGQYSYRINATQKALEGLRVTPDARALRDFSSRVPKGGKKWSPKHYEIAATNNTMLKFGTKKLGQSGWSSAGDEALKKHPSLAYWNDQATIKQQAKTIGTAALKGAGNSFKDIIDVKGITQSGIVKGATKSLAPLGAGLSYYSNYSTAKDDGLDDGAAAGRAAVDTAIDVAIGGAVQVGFTALGTALIPIPGVGTAVGVIVGIAVNSFLNTKMGKDDKSAMDHIKGWFH
ncbi:transposase [Sporosarcina sp. ANT_H38]|uniref:ribonuclease YeeF family protein n=1 Tax=Sporosarcina sp. ANT_H38 TaxID=2597358 RepID=UPI0011F1CF77|nr:LXG domain-containing protein [Sporosarcina sp. ANT_H38]KAA0955566.1 transposase [Sporosarcina sp. ANT_H38]